jgi:hypothetical protein
MTDLKDPRGALLDALYGVSFAMVKNPPKTGLRRRDATGHLDPRYAAELLEQSGEKHTSDPPPAGFVNDATDDLAEQLAENFVQAATSAEDGDDDAGDELIKDEPTVADADDDDIVFEPEELSFPPAKSNRANSAPARARRAPRTKAKVAQSRPAKPKPKPAKPKVGRRLSALKAKVAKTKADKSKQVRKKPKRKPARKTKSRSR